MHRRHAHHVLRAHPAGEMLAQRFQANQRLRQPHLPQGAPTSPALSNLAAWPSTAALRFFLPRVGAIALEEGFRINHRKTRVMSRRVGSSCAAWSSTSVPSRLREEIDNLRALFERIRWD